MKVSTIIECGYIPTGIMAGIYAMPQSIDAAQTEFVHIVAQQPTTIVDSTWTLYAGFVATGIFLVGVKIIDLIMYWRNKNKDTVQGKLSECLSSKDEMKIHYEERLKSKDEIIKSKDEYIASKDQHIDYFKKMLKEISTNLSSTSSAVEQTPESPQAA